MDMQSKFTKYWDEYSVVLAMTTKLDRRIKVQMLKKFIISWILELLRKKLKS